MIYQPKIVDEETIRQAAEAILRAAPGSKVIVFGSYARGQARPDSDLDLMVIEPHFDNFFDETARLRDVIAPYLPLISVDLLLTTQEKFEYWRETPNTVFYEADQKGRVYEPAS